MQEKISVCITAGNEEKNIRRCLESVKWADEIIVIDSFSTDKTNAICKEYTTRVYKHRWLGYIMQKNLAKDLASNEWVLFLDADEEISPSLHDEIKKEFSSPRLKEYTCLEFPRMVKFLGRWIKHGDWYPDIKLRLYRKDCGQCAGTEPHDKMVVCGKCKRLKSPLYHYTYANIHEQLETMNKFSSLTAKSKYNQHEKFKLSQIIFRPPLRFLRCYIFRLGFLDGIPGLLIASTVAFGVTAKYIKLWELKLNDK